MDGVCLCKKKKITEKQNKIQLLDTQPRRIDCIVRLFERFKHFETAKICEDISFFFFAAKTRMCVREKCDAHAICVTFAGRQERQQAVVTLTTAAVVDCNPLRSCALVCFAIQDSRDLTFRPVVWLKNKNALKCHISLSPPLSPSPLIRYYFHLYFYPPHIHIPTAKERVKLCTETTFLKCQQCVVHAVPILQRRVCSLSCLWVMRICRPKHEDGGRGGFGCHGAPSR